MTGISYNPIGIIHSPFHTIEDMPIQPAGAFGVRGYIDINEEYRAGLSDLDGFSHIYILYHFHLVESFKLKTIPFLDDHERGIFATRSPKRPNPVGLSVVKLIEIDQFVLHIENVDIIDGTPLLDIKPYVGEMEVVGEHRIGWLTGHEDRIRSIRSDERFKDTGKRIKDKG